MHGWCCDHTHMASVATHFASLGHRVIALDLRGHGASDKPVQDYPIESFADDAAWISGELGLDRPIIIGHSMGGIAAFDLAARYPSLPGAIVMLDAAIVMPETTRPAIAALLARLSGAGYRTALKDYVHSSLFIPSDDPVRRDRILDAMAAAPQQVMVSAFEGLRGLRTGYGARPYHRTQPLCRRGRALPPRRHGPRQGPLARPLLRTDRWLGTLLPDRSARPDKPHDRALSEGGARIALTGERHD
ncbi:MAG: alpha/beta fold hydrolase [Hyphomicrobium sp.]